MSKQSDYIVYVDESGDHGLATIDPECPVFVPVFCIFRQDVYAQAITPAVQEFKFRYFGHDMVVLHEREIRRQLPPFGFLRVDRGIRQQFLSDLSQLVANANFTLVASVIDKRKLKGRYSRPQNPYNLAMGFGLERVAMQLNSLEKGRETYVVIESRGKREDRDAEL